jgi:hypothetical protein
MSSREQDAFRVWLSVFRVVSEIVRLQNERVQGIYETTRLTRTWPKFSSLKTTETLELKFKRETHESPREQTTPPSSSSSSEKHDIAALQNWWKLQESSIGLHREAREIEVPTTSWSRLWHYTTLAAGISMGTAKEAMRRAWKGSSTDRIDRTILDESNAERLTRTLCRMRGAALKLGQMLSIQGRESHGRGGE